ncbi:MAG: DUF4468 domain-containing protein [Porphyromonadaceae bacterium]|nr:DUF4468 domain-containing protein [Porphyromonadaceae bacterium]
MNVNAQVVLRRATDLEKAARDLYGDNWESAAANLASQLTLDQNNYLTFVNVIDVPGKTKEQLYVLLNLWFTATFNDANSVIKLNDKELGCIIAQGYVKNITQNIGGTYSYDVSIKPIIKCDIKDNKVRVTYTIQNYLIVRTGGLMTGGFGSNSPHEKINWSLNTCYPFVKKDSHKKTSSKALIMSATYSNIILENIEACVKDGLTGTEDDEW